MDHQGVTMRTEKGLLSESHIGRYIHTHTYIYTYIHMYNVYQSICVYDMDVCGWYGDMCNVMVFVCMEIINNWDMRHYESLLFGPLKFGLRLHRTKEKRNLMNQQKAGKEN